MHRGSRASPTYLKGKNMKRPPVALSANLLAATLVVLATSMASDQSANASVETLVKANTAFAVELYRALDTSEGNLFFSPYSISSALGRTYAGARQNTAHGGEECRFV